MRCAEHSLSYPNIGKPIEKAFVITFISFVNDPAPLVVRGCVLARSTWESAHSFYD